VYNNTPLLTLVVP